MYSGLVSGSATELFGASVQILSFRMRVLIVLLIYVILILLLWISVWLAFDLERKKAEQKLDWALDDLSKGWDSRNGYRGSVQKLIVTRLE